MLIDQAKKPARNVSLRRTYRLGVVDYTNMKYESETHRDIVRKIIASHFGQAPASVERIPTGIDNEVYSVNIAGAEYIFRMNRRDTIKGSGKFIPLFRSKGLLVPEIVAEDYSKSIAPYNWQILKKIPGNDIGNAIETLTDDEIRGIAREIVNIIRKLLTIPTNGKFGTAEFSDDNLKDSLPEVLEGMITKIVARNAFTNIVKEKYIIAFKKILAENEEYFRNVPSQFYYDDMSSKNVIVNGGKFAGLVDLDYVSYGDYLEALGIIKAAWQGTTYGKLYLNCMMDELELNDEQRRIVSIWAILNRIFWHSEIGVKFNENTSANINTEKISKNEKILDEMIGEIEKTKLSHQLLISRPLF